MKVTEQTIPELIDFIEKSPTVYNAVENIAAILKNRGFTEIYEGKTWNYDDFADENGSAKVFCVRNGSALIAARIPRRDFDGFLITASHGDSPTFRIKEDPELKSEGYVTLSVERYGGMICSTWMDKPLSCAGRIAYRDADGSVKTKTVNVDRDLLLIPNVAIHMDRTVNESKKFNVAVDMKPLMGIDGGRGFYDQIAESANVRKEDIISTELYLYNRQRGVIWGDGQFISAPRLDDLQCAYGCLKGFLGAKTVEQAAVYCVFDNEEVGSGTKQGADSTFLSDFLCRVCDACAPGKTTEYMRRIANSFMISADNAHSVHPNHPEFADQKDRPKINGGIVVKYNAAQKYTTDCVSAALFEELCRKANVPVQHFTNRADMAGGSTLGNISNAHVSLDTVDIGLAELAMHSSYETAGTLDTLYLENAIAAFYASVTFKL